MKHGLLAVVVLYLLYVFGSAYTLVRVAPLTDPNTEDCILRPNLCKVKK